jgi:putative hydrolase
MEAARRHGAMMIMGSDAHIEFDVGNHAYAMELIEQYGFPEELIINSSPEKFKEWIAD